MKNNRRLVLAWIVALGLVGFGVLADLYLVYVWGAQPLATNQAPNPYQQLYEDLLYPSVRIETTDGTGSGVVITSTTQATYILTAAHVVGNEALVTVEFYHQDTKSLSSSSCLCAFVVMTDTSKDLALLQIQHSSFITHHYSARLAPRDYTPYIFTPVWVVGCSLGYPPRPTAGEITAVSNHRDTENTENNLRDLHASVVKYWEMNAPIWPGNSGGGVFLKNTHELIGIAVWCKVYHGQLATTMGGIVTLQNIYEFLKGVKSYAEKESD